MKKKVLITGGTGLVGKRLVQMLIKAGHEVAILSRTAKPDAAIKTYAWDIAKGEIDKDAFVGVNAIIHLAGAGVADKKWTPERKEEIYNSRTQSSLLLFKYLSEIEHQVDTFIAASAIGIYGLDTGNRMVKENAGVGHDFLAHVTDAWETSTLKVSTLGIRLVQMRIGIVLSNSGGALEKILQPPVVAPLGKGNQYMSWIHIDDLCEMFIYALEKENISGVFNAVAPKAQTNRDFSKVAAKVFKKPYLPIPVPKLALKLMLGEMSQIVLGGNRVSSEQIMKAGFAFKFPKLEEALQDLKEA